MKYAASQGGWDTAWSYWKYGLFSFNESHTLGKVSLELLPKNFLFSQKTNDDPMAEKKKKR